MNSRTRDRLRKNDFNIQTFPSSTHTIYKDNTRTFGEHRKPPCIDIFDNNSIEEIQNEIRQ